MTSLRAAPPLEDTIAALEKGSGVLGRFGNWLAAATDLGTGSVEVEVLVSTEPAFTVGPLRVELVELFARSLEAKAGCWDTS